MQPATRTAARRVLLVAGDTFPGFGDADARRHVDAMTDADVLIVAPAGSVPDERWIIDVSAREADARCRLDGWTAALADRTSTLRTEIGDEDPDLAISDALHGFEADAVLRFGPEEPVAAEAGVLARQLERPDRWTPSAATLAASQA